MQKESLTQRLGDTEEKDRRIEQLEQLVQRLRFERRQTEKSVEAARSFLIRFRDEINSILPTL